MRHDANASGAGMVAMPRRELLEELRAQVAFPDDVVGAALPGVPAELIRMSRGDEQHDRLGSASLDLVRCSEAAQTGHSYVHQDDVRLQFVSQRDRGFAGFRLACESQTRRR